MCFVALPPVYNYLKWDMETCSEKLSVIVVSSLVSLMKDQVSVREVFNAPLLERSRALKLSSKLVVYASPESLLTVQRWRDMLSSPVYTNNLVAVIGEICFHLRCIPTTWWP